MERNPERENLLMAQFVVGEPLVVGTGNINSDATEAEVQEIAETLTDRYLVPVREGACGVCGDGRGCSHTLAETAPEPGPSVFGGPLITGFAAAELVGDYFDDQSTDTSIGRVKEVGDKLTDGGIVIGGHVSAGAATKTNRTWINPETGLPETGCGANDSFTAIIDQTTDNADFVNAVTEQLLGGDFKPEFTSYAPKEDLQAQLSDYNSHDVLQDIATRGAERNVEVLEGAHAELVVVFNYARGYTIDRDAFVRDTGKQVFVVDMWYIDDIAHAMAYGRPDAPEMYERLRHAMVAFQAATYPQLCNGTHRPVIIKPQENPAAVPASL